MTDLCAQSVSAGGICRYLRQAHHQLGESGREQGGSVEVAAEDKCCEARQDTAAVCTRAIAPRKGGFVDAFTGRSFLPDVYALSVA
jgi:hypothetical protein